MDDEEEYQPRASVEFVETSILDTIIPASTGIDIEDALNGSVERLDERNKSPLANIAQRRSLFFDETIDAYVVLQTPFLDEDTLRAYLARLVIVLEARVVNARQDHDEGPSSNELIYSGSVQEKDSEEPLVIVQPPDENDQSNSDGHILVVWKLPVLLNRPQRLRPQSPSVTFSATANLKSTEQVNNDVKSDEYMQSQRPAGLNLLQSFSNDRTLGSVVPQLSALRVSRVVPTSRIAKDLMRPLKNISRRTLKIFPAISARVRYAKPNSTPSNPAVIASLDLDITPYAGKSLTIESVSFKVTEGLVESLNIDDNMAFPLSCLPRDDITYLYRLIPSELEITKSNIKPVHIGITARVAVSTTCRPIITLRWTTSIDFSVPVNPGFNPPTTTLTRENRPSNLSISSSTFESAPSVASLAATQPDALPTVELTTRHQRSASIPDFGVTMTFTSLSTSMPKVGEEFVWEVFIVNRSDRPRKLALVILPRRRRTNNVPSVNRPPSTHGSKDSKNAEAVTDENILYATQRSAAVEPSEIVSLSTDIRIGPLSPSACQAVELRFLPMKSGVLGLECIRVIDLGTQEHVDIRDLPSIVVDEL